MTPSEHVPFENQLSEYLDGYLEGGEREGLERHLAGCPACRSVLAGLEEVRAEARDARDLAPERDLWPGIRGMIRPQGEQTPTLRKPQGGSFNLGQLLAACLAVAVLSGGGAWMLARRPARPVPPAASADPSGSHSLPGVGATPTRTTPADLATHQPVSSRSGEAPSRAPGSLPAASAASSTAVASEDLAALRRALQEGRSQLDPATVRILELDLQIIDTAVHQARLALLADPGNSYLRGHLEDTLKRKRDLMDRAVHLARQDL